jgi:hypothetical protein
MLSRFFFLTTFLFCACTPTSRPAEGHLRRCLVVGRHLRGKTRAQKARDSSRDGSGLKPQGEASGLMRRRARESRSRCLGVPAPGHWRGPRARHPACGRPRPSPGSVREVRATALKAHPSRSARPRTKAPRAGCRGRFRSCGGWPCPCPVLFARDRPRRGPPGPRAPLSFSRARDPPGPHPSDPVRAARTRTHAPTKGDRRDASLAKPCAPADACGVVQITPEERLAAFTPGSSRLFASAD